jgi:hypothetical protein
MHNSRRDSNDDSGSTIGLTLTRSSSSADFQVETRSNRGGTGDEDETWYHMHMFIRRALIFVSNETKARDARGCLENHHLQRCFGQTEDSEAKLNARQVLVTSVKSGLIPQRRGVAFASLQDGGEEAND